MEKKKQIAEYRERLDKALASHDLVNEKSIKNLVRNQLIQSSPPDTHGDIDLFLENRTAEVSNLLNMLRSASRNDNEVSETQGVQQRDWKLKQDSEDIRVMYREGVEGTPFHTLLVEGYIDGPLDICLCLSWEAPLFRKWWPQSNVPPFKITVSDRLQEVRVGEQIILFRVKVAWPVSAREIIMHYFLLEYFEEDLTIVLIKSISDTDGIDKSTHGFTRDGIPDAKDFVRMDCVGGFAFQKVTSNTSYFRTISTIDIKLDFVPPSLINFFSRQLIGSGFKLYKKSVASIAQGDEDFSKALDAPLYVRIREGLASKNKLKKALKSESLKKALKSESLKNDKTANRLLRGNTTKIPQVDTMPVEHIIPSDSHATTSSQSDPVAGQTYNGEIEEVEVEQKPESVTEGITSNGKIEPQTHSDEDEFRNHSTTNLAADQCIKEKALISPRVERALCVLDNAISMVRNGHPIQNWSAFESNNQELRHLQRVAAEAGSASSEDGSGDGFSLKALDVDNIPAPWGDECGSGFFEIRYDKLDSPVREANHNHNHNQTTLTSPKQIPTPMKTTQDNGFRSSQKILAVPVSDNMNGGHKEITIKINGAHEGSNNASKFKKQKPRRCCSYFFQCQ